MGRGYRGPSQDSSASHPTPPLDPLQGLGGRAQPPRTPRLPRRSWSLSPGCAAVGDKTGGPAAGEQWASQWGLRGLPGPPACGQEPGIWG